MTAITRTPQNTNLLQPTKFLLSFDRIGSVQYFCQSANIPGMSVGEAPISNPMLDIQAPGNKMVYNKFTVKFIVDEKMDSWQQIHSWFRSMASPESFNERNTLSERQNIYRSNKLRSYSDATLTVMSALNNPIIRVQFINMFPISLSDIDFDTTLSADTIITADATFAFDYFNFLPL
jgi:hypothetical protein